MTQPAPPLIARLSNVTKTFGNTRALHDLSMDIHQGQAVALLGPNGAGKSTALSILEGLRQPTSGTASLFGQKPGTPAAMKRIGITPQETDFPPQLTPRELLAFTTAHFDHPRPIGELIELFGLEELADRRVQGFSGGQRRRLALAMCFAGNPELAILDEPTAGLDTQGQKDFSRIARNYVAEGGSLILTSHYWQEIETIADRIVMIDNGKTVMDGTIARIKAAFGLNRVSLASDTPGPFISQTFSREDNRFHLITNDSDDVIRKLVQSGEAFSDLKVSPRSLEEAIALYNATQNTNSDTESEK
ncbi:MAG TPA: ABC transporter ATP-binding protein [Devosia sp.]|nr:ABC transporter ATP-binding protein [Devosia sp.]